MAVSRLATLSGIFIDPDILTGSSVNLGGIRRQMIRSGTDVRQETTSGAIFPTWQSVYANVPQAEFSTLSIKRAMDTVGTAGLAIGASAQTGLTFFGYSKAEGGARRTGANQISYNVKEGILIPRRITCSHQSDAELFCETLITFDGTNAPVVQSNAATILTYLDDQRYSIGPVQLGTTSGDAITLTQISNIEIDFGINATAEGSDSDVFPTFASIQDIAKPTIKITTSDPRMLALSSGIPFQGKDISSAKTIIYLRKRSRISVSGYVADNVASHISIVPLVGCAYLSDIGDYGGSGQNGSVVIEIPLISTDGITAPWSWSTTALIAFP